MLPRKLPVLSNRGFGEQAGINDLCSGGMTTHVNKVHHVTTITQVAKDLGEDEDWLRDVANEIAIEHGVIWVYGISEDGVQVHRLSI